MPKFTLLVQTNAVDEQHEEFNDWYTNQHLADVLSVPGVRSAERHRVMQGGEHGYVALYNLDCDDPLEVLESLKARADTDKMRISPAMNRESVTLMVLEPIAQLP